jgi:hypothetical protein
MHGGNKLKSIDTVEISLRNITNRDTITVWIDVWDNSLARRWLNAIDDVLARGLVLQKHYCFLGFADSPRDGKFICQEINRSIAHINRQAIGYKIDDVFVLEECMDNDRRLLHDRFNQLHRYFEDLQGVSGRMSPYWHAADPETRWHISQLNLLCHEFETWAMSWRKKHTGPEWQRPSQLMCWNQAPRFNLEKEDLDLFGIHTIARPLGGVFVGVNKAVGKHHWEVFQDEGRDSRINELTTSTLRSQTEAAADFDIEWGQDPSHHPFMHDQLAEFRTWLEYNGFHPDDPALTIGHPQIGQVDLERSFGTQDYSEIWHQLYQYLDVVSVRTSRQSAKYDYCWYDSNYIQLMVGEIT